MGAVMDPGEIGPAEMLVDTINELAKALELAEWDEVESSNIARLAFVEGGSIGLREYAPHAFGWVLVEFRHGGVYAYAEVPTCVYELVKGAESVTGAFNLLVKNRSRWAKLR